VLASAVRVRCGALLCVCLRVRGLCVLASAVRVRFGALV
jgi:hypothetical protein